MNTCKSSAMNPKLFGGDNPLVVNISGVKAIDYNPAMKQRIITNIGLTVIFIVYGVAPTSGAYQFALPACGIAEDGTGGVYIDEMWNGPIFLFSSSNGGKVTVSELI